MNIKSFAFTTSAAILGISAGFSADNASAADEKEKCYGVAKSGKNDCGWSGGSCAGTATSDAHPETWIFVAKGTCDKLVGGSLVVGK